MNRFMTTFGLILVGVGTLYSAEQVAQEEGSYRDYIQGTFAAGYMQPFNGDKYVNADRHDPEGVGTFSVDLFVMPKYYGGLYVGYKMTLSNAEDADVLSIEKRYKNVSIFYKKTSTQEKVTPWFDNDILFIKSNNKSTYGEAGVSKSIPFDQSRYEIRYYGFFDTSMDLPDKKFGYISFFYEDTERLLIGRDTDGKLTKKYYVDGEVNVYALALGVMQRDFELPEGWFVTGSINMGLATMDYTDDFSYGDNGIGESPVLEWGMYFEFGYNVLFENKMQILLAVYGGYTTAGDSLSFDSNELYSQGDVGARIAYSF